MSTKSKKCRHKGVSLLTSLPLQNLMNNAITVLPQPSGSAATELQIVKQNGLSPSVCLNPHNMIFREMVSYASIPSNERIVDWDLDRCQGCRACAMHPHPARVDNAHWNSAVILPTCRLICRATVRAASRLPCHDTPHSSRWLLEGCHPSNLDPELPMLLARSLVRRGQSVLARVVTMRRRYSLP